MFNNTNLSARELEVLFYLVRGKVVSDISSILQISKRTIESYIENIKAKLACNNKAELIEKALENNFIDRKHCLGGTGSGGLGQVHAAQFLVR